jgi:hypothetical protein
VLPLYLILPTAPFHAPSVILFFHSENIKIKQRPKGDLMSNGFPAGVYIIRHGEKLGDAGSDKDGGPDLSIRGSARAAALPSLFVLTDVSCPLAAGTGGFTGRYATVQQVPAKPARLKTPSVIFATQASSSSNRPVETVTPTGTSLNLSINSSFPNSQSGIDALGAAVLGGQYTGKVVLICWHHGEIPAVATALKVAKPPQKWKSTVFDEVWEITYSSKGAAKLKTHHQKLLYGDSQ